MTSARALASAATEGAIQERENCDHVDQAPERPHDDGA